MSIIKSRSFLFAFCGISILSAQISQAQTINYKPNPKGYLVERYGVSQEQERMINRFSRMRTVSIDSLLALGLPQHVFRLQRDSVTDVYYERVKSILTPDQRAKFNPDAMKAARSGEIKILKLPVEKEIAMGAMKAEFEKAIKELSSQDTQDANERKRLLEVEYRQKLRGLLGAQKYEEWLSYKNGATERKFKNQFGFTAEQFEQYQAIEKWYVVQIMLIKNSETSPDERLVKMNKIKQIKVDSLKAILPREQFERWNAYYMRKENQRSQIRRK